MNAIAPPMVEMKEFSIDHYKGQSPIWTHIIFFDVSVRREVERMLQTTDVFISHGDINERFRNHSLLSVAVKVNPLLENPRVSFLTDYVDRRLNGTQPAQLSIGPAEEEALLYADMEGYL
jgi:hypothetical protein